MKRRPPLSVIVPAKDEALALPDLLLACKRVKLPKGTEWILVDDGSVDGSGALARRAGWKVLRLEGRGYGGALRAGFAAARGQYLAFLDADGTYPPQALVTMWAARVQGGAVMVNRFTAASHMPWIRALGNRVYGTLASLRFGRRVPDPCSGQRLFDRACLDLKAEWPDGLDFSPALTMRWLKRGIPIHWLSWAYLERDGDSKLKVWSDGWRFLGRVLFWR